MIVAATVNAQVTTSAMAGHVADKQGEDIISALVRVVHKPSGTTYNAVTNVDGRWAIQGMRVGGPYEVKITYVGFADSVIEDITLQLGETYNLNVTMTEDVTELGEVVVTGTRSKFAAEKTGATTNISNTQLTALPTVSRSISDIVRTYIAARWGIGAMEMTSDEIIEAMRGEELPDKARMDLTAILRDADLVKFAKATPEAEQNENDYLKAYYFVEETKLVEEPAPVDEEAPLQN